MLPNTRRISARDSDDLQVYPVALVPAPGTVLPGVRSNVGSVSKGRNYQLLDSGSWTSWLGTAPVGVKQALWQLKRCGVARALQPGESTTVATCRLRLQLAGPAQAVPGETGPAPGGQPSPVAPPGRPLRFLILRLCVERMLFVERRRRVQLFRSFLY